MNQIPLEVEEGRYPLCEHCNKRLRKTKRIDFVGRTLHFSCINKLRKEQYEKDLSLLYSYLKSKNIELLI